MKWINLLNQVGAQPPGKNLRVDSASAAVLVMRGDAEYIDDPDTPDIDESLGFVFTINGKSGMVSLSKADLGLSKVDNTSDEEKPISELVAAELDGKLSITDAPSVVATAITAPEVKTALDATYAPSGYALKQLAANPDQLAVGAITRSASGAATGFSVAWPDGATGTFTGTESTTFPGAIDTYAITHVLEGVTTTYTQPALTRDTTGAVTARPAIVVS
ncbi:hypothetical protein SEA_DUMPSTERDUDE_30 [Gordonia phage DumpsterDude]|uniref:Uncharacterized protein n=1 Tax=Gordonia phage DumpsterDude TaxID=2713262 RepID=A0A6G8R0X9_9CAUD|nr:minor tail protein [Gordonia phage DumpsterDude]QIN93618.1 hypothetical protein SEA_DUMPSTERDUDE_30 [Gordonia phage DumpsterDude]